MRQKLIAFVVLAATPAAVFANNASTQICSGANTTCDNNPATSALGSSIGSIVSTLLTVAGAIAVIIIIVGGLTYITSNGDAGRTKQAKDTILYAVIGLIVTILAYAIVHYVATAIK